MRPNLLIFSIVSLLWGGLSLVGQDRALERNPVVVDWQIRVDDTNGFTFDSLKADIQYRPGKYHAWKDIPLIIPSRDGKFITTLPAGSWISIHVTTDDPTISWETGEPKQPDNYTMRENIPQTVYREQFYLGEGPARTVKKVLQLHRGAAFTLCLPPSLNAGLVRFHRKQESTGTDFISFSSQEGLTGTKVGGLKPGHWVVEFVTEKSVVVLTQELQLKKGVLLNPQCASGVVSGAPR